MYTRVAREFGERHITVWAVTNGTTLTGEDLNVDHYAPRAANRHSVTANAGSAFIGGSS